MSQLNPYYQSEHWRRLREACLARDHYRCFAAGCRLRAIVADHIRTRPNVPYPTPFDVLENLRSLCRRHDAQVKELPGSRVRRGGGERFRVIGCDAEGWPLDPNHRG